MTIKEHQPKSSFPQGENITLSCNYSTSDDYIHWYRQYSRSAPEYLLHIIERSGKVQNAKPRMSAKVDKDNKRVDLELSSTEVTDSAVYYCALRPTVTGNSPMLYKNMTALLNMVMHNQLGAAHAKNTRFSCNNMYILFHNK
uniref:T-cell receptor alpha/delta variable 14.0 n=1 Tax=Paramormyrops kingsleyae TaxID=1676925 RepID=A0A3B3Q537_9TELE